MVTMSQQRPLPLGNPSPLSISSNSSIDTLPYFSPNAMQSPTQNGMRNNPSQREPLVSSTISNNLYTAEPITPIPIANIISVGNDANIVNNAANGVIVPVPNNDETRNKACICMTFFHICYTILALALPITILIMNSIYGDNVKCYLNNSIPIFDHVNLVETIGLKIWLNVFAAIGIVNVAVYFSALFLFYYGNGNSLYMIYSGLGLLFNYVVFSLFRFIWIIVGCFLFWRDCLGVQSQQVVIYPQQMSDLMWATLLIGIIFDNSVIIAMVYNGYKIYTFIEKPAE